MCLTVSIQIPETNIELFRLPTLEEKKILAVEFLGNLIQWGKKLHFKKLHQKNAKTKKVCNFKKSAVRVTVQQRGSVIRVALQGRVAASILTPTGVLSVSLSKILNS